MANSNCLDGMRCRCGSEGPFRITVRTVIEMHDDGSENLAGDLEFDNDAGCTCCHCKHAGVVGDFRAASVSRIPTLTPLVR